LNSSSIFGQKFGKFGANFVIRDIIRNNQHFMKKYKKEIGAFLDPKYVDKIHKYNHKWLLDAPKWLWKKFENIF
jgi:hypothetical protein